MQARPSPSHRLIVLDVAIEAIATARPLVTRIRRFDRDLGEQLRRALSSTALNIGEGGHSEGGNRNRISRFSTAAGSAAEARAGLRVATAWGYVEAGEVEAIDALLDRVARMLHGLGARR
jgi:four helix bundle protein